MVCKEPSTCFWSLGVVFFFFLMGPVLLARPHQGKKGPF